MNRTIFMATLTAMAVIAAAACEKTTGDQGGQPAELTISVRSGITSKGADETAIMGVQILIFRSDGNLDAYTSSTSSSDIKVSCTSGQRTIYAAANAPDLTDILTLNEFQSKRTKLTDNSSKSLVMISEEKSIMVPTSEAITMEVHRIVAKVTVSEISAKFTSSAYSQKEFKVTRIYLTNAAGDADYFGLTSPQTWYNQMKYETSDADNFLFADIKDATITESAPYTTAHSFYTYPNDTESDTTGAGSDNEFSARYTRLVIEATLAGTTYYYPVSIPGILSNHTYEITNLTITRPGSLDPDTPVSSDTCSINIEVTDWVSGGSNAVNI